MVDLIQLGLFGDRHMTFDHAVVQRIGDAVLQVTEHPDEVSRATEAEPDRGDQGGRSRDDQEDHQEVMPPPLDFPDAEDIEV